MMETLPTECDRAWLPDPDAQWWCWDGRDWRALEDVDAMVALWQRAPDTKFARGGEVRVRAGSSELFGCWVRPRGASGTGRWVDQEEARRAWYRGEELWWGSGWERREGVPEETSPPLPSPPPERTERSPAPLPNAFEVGSYTFVRVNVGHKCVWVGPPIEPVLSRRKAPQKAGDLCKLLCSQDYQGSHAYIFGDYPIDEDPLVPSEESYKHIRIATREEVEAYWASKASLSKPTWAAQGYRVWVANHAQRPTTLTANDCSFEDGDERCRLRPKSPTFIGSCHAHFAVYADLLSPEHNNLATFAVEK
jgi:hypothetical protein